MTRANREVMAIARIETRPGVENGERVAGADASALAAPPAEAAQ
jgi:hypothetical protein